MTLRRGATLVAAMLAAASFGGPGSAQLDAAAATPGSPATIALGGPQTSGTMLVVRVRAFAPPERGTVEAVVSAGSVGHLVEVGRFVVFPAGPFAATRPADERAFSFDARPALALSRPPGAPLVVEVALVPLDPGQPVEGALLTLGGAELRAVP